MEEKEYEVMYSVEDDHWWYSGLRKLVLAFVDSFISRREKQVILDAGCGTGGMLAECDAYDAFGLDISEEAIRFCRMRNLVKLSKGSLLEMPLKDNSFNIVISLDVLYHLSVSDDAEALSELHRVSAQRGMLVLNVPAYDFLKGPHDRASHARHRYTLRELRDKVERAGFEIERITYRNSLLFPLIVSMRIVKKFISPDRGRIESDVGRLPAFLNSSLRNVLTLENRLILGGVNFPFGLSIFCVARKK
ncbi:MAG: class I SAM-dependent methyltransferase [Nitrospirae bacterium]|nr:class I SAM-dependent methyltransferase [Nitrospirota bacterium]